jgi:hypothetical protein
MPFEDVEIPLSELDPYSSGAQYFSILVYPDPADRGRRADYQQSLARWTLERRMELDPKWRNGLQLIRPAYFSGSDKVHDKMLREGNRHLRRRRIICERVVLPHLRGFDTGRIHRVDGGAPDFERMLLLATTDLGLSENSYDTVASRYWAPLKPVAHALCAYTVWSNILWEMRGRKPDVDRELAFMMLPEYVVEVAEIAEHFRTQVSQIKSFEIREEMTIRISTRWIDGERGNK